MSAAPLLAALLARALPDPAVLDLGAGLFPWMPGAMPGVPDAAALPAAERDLLRRFRRGVGLHPLFGFDPVADAALLAGAPLAWGEAPERLVALPGPPPPALLPLLRQGPAEPLLLLPSEAGDLPGEGRARLLLLLGTPAHIEGWTLLLPPARLAAVFEALRDAAAVAAGDGGWQLGGRVLSPRMASLTLLGEDATRFAPTALLPAEALAHDGALPAADGRLPFGGAGRLRLLLGRLPARPHALRIGLRAGMPGTALPVPFLDGMRCPAQAATPGPDGTAWLEVAAHPAPGGHHTVLGLALPPAAGETGLALSRVEILA